MAQEQIFSLTEFNGLGDPFRFGIEPQVTRTMENVSPSYGRLIPRNGYTALGAAQASRNIGLFEYQLHNLNTKLVRMDLTDIFKWDPIGLDWTSIKGAVNIESTNISFNIADFAVYGNILYGITPNEKLIRWDGGAGNITQNTATPNANVIEAFEGFLVLGHAANDNGAATAKDPQRLRYESTNVDGTWDTTKTIVINQTPGMIWRIKTFGRTLFVYKNDGIVAVRFIGGDPVFQVDNLNSAVGILSPTSLANIPGLGQIFLATDRKLYLNSGNIQQIKSRVNNTIAEQFNVAQLPNCMATVDVSNNLYQLFYPSDSSSFLNRRLDFNYITGDFSIHDYPTGLFVHATYANTSNDDALVSLKKLVASQSDKRTYDVGTGTTDNGTTIDHSWNSDWMDFGFPGEKYLNRVDITLKEDARSRVEISTRADFEREFQQAREYGISSMKTDGDITISHRIRPTLGKWHDLRIRFMPASTPSNMELKRVDFFYTPVRISGQRETPINVIGS